MCLKVYIELHDKFVQIVQTPRDRPCVALVRLNMPPNIPASLKSEISRIAKLSGIQQSLPLPPRHAPGLAILAGEVIAKVTNGCNVLGERLLGPDEIILLADPSQHTRLARGYLEA